jgi:hypothetical protein
MARNLGTLTGRRVGRSGIEPEQVQQIRSRLAAGEIQRSIAAAYGIDPSVVSEIKCGKTYQWVGDSL